MDAALVLFVLSVVAAVLGGEAPAKARGRYARRHPVSEARAYFEGR
jgi:hypothetical protein